MCVLSCVRYRPAAAKGARKWYRAPWLSPPPQSTLGHFLPLFLAMQRSPRVPLNRIRLRRLYVGKTYKRRYRYRVGASVFILVNRVSH